jgi:hypothetical protein
MVDDDEAASAPAGPPAAAPSTSTRQEQGQKDVSPPAAVGPLSPRGARSARAVPFLTGNPHTAHQRAVSVCGCRRFLFGGLRSQPASPIHPIRSSTMVTGHASPV